MQIGQYKKNEWKDHMFDLASLKPSKLLWNHLIDVMHVRKKRHSLFHVRCYMHKSFVLLSNIGFQSETSTVVDNYIHAVAYSSVTFLVANSGMRLLRRQHANSTGK